MLKKDQYQLGIILGFLTPIIGFIVYYLLRFRLFSVKEYLYVLWMETSLLSGIITFSLVANVFIFTFYINRKSDKTAIGIFIASLIYGVIALFLKWFA